MARKRKRQYSSLFSPQQVGSDDLNVSVKPASGSASVNAGIGNENRLNVSAGYGPNGFGVKPSVRFGNSPGAQQGAAVGGTVGQFAGTALGGPAGGAVGSFVGSAAGSVAGGGDRKSQAALAGTAVAGPFGGAVGAALGSLKGKSVGAKETDDRKSIINSYKDGGLFDSDGNLALADGTVFNAFADSHANQHDWKYQDKRVDKEGDRKLFNYEIDYTNDLDYLSGMAGVSLSRMLSGGTNKAIDQTGGLLGNAFLGKSGHGAELSQENFDNVITNARSAYAKKGIDSKEEFTALANKMFSEGRIKDSDYAVMNQTAAMVFDKDFNTATKLMSGRNKGIEVAGQSPADANATMNPANQPGRIYSPIISPQEAMLSVAPYLQQYKAAAGNRPEGPSNTASDLTQAAGLITSAAGIYGTINKATGGAIGDYISSGYHAIRDMITGNEGLGEEIQDITGSFEDALTDFDSDFGLA